MDQMIFYSVTEAERFDESITKKGLLDIKEKGFDSIYLEYRNINSSLTGNSMKMTIDRIVKKAKQLGLKVIADSMPFRILNEEIREEDPQIFNNKAELTETEIIDGKFSIVTQGERLHCDVIRCFLVEYTGRTAIGKCTDITDKLVFKGANVEGGGCAMTKKSMRASNTWSFEVDGISKGRICVLVEYRYLYQAPDLTNPALKKYNTKMLEYYAQQDIDGYMWDEPHFGFAFIENNARAVGDCFYDAFLAKFGYDLRDRILSLWYDVEGQDSALTRLHYAEIQESGLAEAEKDFYEKASAYMMETAKKDDFMIGMHRTMHEELSDDFYIGCSDYFRHNEYTSAGFCDSVFEREDSMICFNQFGRSMSAAKGNGKRAHNNSWGFVPAQEHHDFYLPLMGAMNVAWIGHTYHWSVLFGPGYPDSKLWGPLGDALLKHKKALDFLEGASMLCDTAVVYNWRALASFPDNYIHVHRRDLTLMSKELTYLNVQHQFISTEMLENAKVCDREFCVPGAKFKKLILPWADMLSAKCFAKLKEMAEQGVEIVIFGPPAGLTAEGGCCFERFMELCGAEKTEPVCKETIIGDTARFKEESYSLDPYKIQKNMDNVPERTVVDSFKYYVLKASEGAEEIADINGECTGIAAGSVRYFAFEIPQYIGLTKAVFRDWSAFETPEDLIVFEYSIPGGKALMGLGAWSKEISGKVVWEGRQIVLDAKATFGIKKLDDGTVLMME